MSVRENYEEIMANVQAAAEASGRKKENITLIAVSKFVDEGRIKEAIACGAKNFGESRAQELTAKLPMFEQAGSNVHFIGQLQTNKVKYVIGNVKTIQSVDRLELANEISRLAQKKGIVQQVLIEVNIGGEPQKGGAYAEGLEEFLTNISRLNGVFVKGLMCIPPAVDEADARRYFAKMKMLFDRMAGLGLPNVAMDELSMGMSGDYRAAIAEGATMVRVGSAIFGERRRPGAEA